jgi:hypothetical protein
MIDISQEASAITSIDADRVAAKSTADAARSDPSVSGEVPRCG